MLQDRRNIVFLGFEKAFHMINKGQIHAGIISKETQLNIILSNALLSSLSSLISSLFKKFENEYVNHALLAPYVYKIGM